MLRRNFLKALIAVPTMIKAIPADANAASDVTALCLTRDGYVNGVMFTSDTFTISGDLITVGSLTRPT